MAAYLVRWSSDLEEDAPVLGVIISDTLACLWTQADELDDPAAMEFMKVPCRNGGVLLRATEGTDDDCLDVVGLWEGDQLKRRWETFQDLLGERPYRDFLREDIFKCKDSSLDSLGYLFGNDTQWEQT